MFFHFDVVLKKEGRRTINLFLKEQNNIKKKEIVELICLIKQHNRVPFVYRTINYILS